MKYPQVGGTVRFLYTTHAATGAAVAPSGAIDAADILIYKNGSATQRSSTAGFTSTSPFDSITGLHQIAIDLSDNTDAGFYAIGAEYEVVLSPDTETVDGVAVVRVIGTFRIVPAEDLAGYPKIDLHGVKGTAATAAAGIPEVKVASLAANALNAAAIADAAIDAATYAADLDHYAAKLWVQRQSTGTPTDLYTAIWTKNGVDVVSGITTPLIQVVKVSDGSDLIAETAMTEIASLGMYKKASTAALLTAGTSYIVILTATIDGSARKFRWVQGRDV